MANATARCILLLVLINHVTVEGRRSIKNSLTKTNINEAIIKTIEGENGEFIDCFDIYKQPAFDHPSLPNHTIQMRPISYPNGMKAEKLETDQLIQPWHKYGKCSQGTVPIRRAPENYSHKRERIHGSKNPSFGFSDASNPIIHEYAVVEEVGEKFQGIQAKINNWKPMLGSRSEASISQIWIVAGHGKDNTIEAGWEVNPGLYGDFEPRFFLYWTRDNYQTTGCYNVRCPGFVQTNNEIALGSLIAPISLQDGQQYDASFRIFRDQSNGNWWFELQGIQIGYWPSSIFTTLNEGGIRAKWGGEIANNRPDGHHTSTQMGSGHFPSEGYGKASYFRNLGIVDGTNTLRDPNKLRSYITNPKCYDLQIQPKDPSYGVFFYYGGLGYSPNCP